MNKLGGGGQCEYCKQWDSNVSYHSSNECRSNPDSWASRIAIDDALEAAKKKDLPEPIGLTLECSSCHNPILVPSALLFSPPLPQEGPKIYHDDTMTVKKYHLCLTCYSRALKVLNINQYQTPCVVDLNKRRL
jgi:hypothetical protein